MSLNILKIINSNIYKKYNLIQILNNILYITKKKLEIYLVKNSLGISIFDPPSHTRFSYTNYVQFSIRNQPQK